MSFLIASERCLATAMMFGARRLANSYQPSDCGSCGAPGKHAARPQVLAHILLWVGRVGLRRNVQGSSTPALAMSFLGARGCSPRWS